MLSMCLLNIFLFLLQRAIEAQMEERRQQREQEDERRRVEERAEERRVALEREMMKRQYELDTHRERQKVRGQNRSSKSNINTAATLQ